MISEQRAAIAAIALVMNSQSAVNSIYSYKSSSYVNFSITLKNNILNAYDYGRVWYITGTTSTNNNFNLYDYGTSAYVSLMVTKDCFSGYDFNSGYHFSGTIK